MTRRTSETFKYLFNGNFLKINQPEKSVPSMEATVQDG